jgi:glutathione reductase (NADPH)
MAGDLSVANHTGSLFMPHHDACFAVYCSTPLCACTVGYSEEEAVAKLSGEIDVYVSKFRPMK